MPIFKCSKCGMVENTATCHYWSRDFDQPAGTPPSPPLCSLCDPGIAAWHGRFERMTPESQGYVEGPDGFLYHPDDKYLARLRKERSEKGAGGPL